MKEMDIYKDLDKKEIRQFLMNSLTKISYDAMFGKEYRKNIEETIEKLKNQLEENNSYLALMEMIRLN